MKKKHVTSIGSFALGIVFFTACGNSKEQPTAEYESTSRQQPSVIELLTEMDEDKDGQLSRSEVKGPLEQDFDRIDSDRDGFLSVEELKNAPKPEGERPERPPQGGRPGGGPPRN